MLKNLLFCLSAVLLLGQFSAKAQQRSCGTMNNLERLEKLYPGTKAQLANADRAIQKWQPKTNQRTGATILTIPVVVHVVYKTTAQNISDAQILSQIASLNEDFNRLNADTANIPSAFKSALGNIQIRFELAKRTPDGDPTTGITRTLTNTSSFQDDDAVKFASRGGHDIWDRDKFLNIWVCNLGGGLLGYAQFPGSGPVGADGVVIGYNYLGRTGAAIAPFNKGRTATHEIGHWLGLYHIWGDEPACANDDQVSDTPLQKDYNSGCPTFPNTSGGGEACTAGSPGSMFMNYMDYVDDACMNMFTNGQRTRMHAALNTSRPALFTTDGLVPVTQQSLDAAIFKVLDPKSGNTCYNTITPKVTLKNRGTTALTAITVSYKIDNGTVQTFQWTGNLSSLATSTITLPAFNNLTVGAHTFSVSTSLPNGQTDNDPANDNQTISFTVVQPSAGVSLPFGESFETAPFPPIGWTRTNPDNDITWVRTTRAATDGSRSIFMNNYDYYYIGEVDELVMPALNLTTQTAPQLSFQLSYSPSSFNIPSDTLEILASTDCGETFTSLYKKTKQALATTTSPTFVDFTPTATQWRLETVSLANYANQNNVILKFKHTNRYENNLYLDDVKVSGLLGLKAEKFDEKLALFPNPTTGEVTLKHAAFKQVEISLTNLVGQQITEPFVSSTTETVLYLSGKPAGVYLVQVKAADKVYVQKLILTE